MIPDASDTAEQQIAALRQELVATKHSLRVWKQAAKENRYAKQSLTYTVTYYRNDYNKCVAYLKKARQSRKRLVWSVRKWRKDIAYANAQIKRIMSALEVAIVEERTQAEAKLAAAQETK